MRAKRLSIILVLAGAAAFSRLPREVRAQGLGPKASAAPSASVAATALAAPSASASSITVNEEAPPPLSKPTRVLAGWKELWGEIGKDSLDLRIALAELERAEAATRISKGAVYPTVNGVVSLTHVPESGSGSSAIATPARDTFSAQLNVNATLINLRGFHAVGTAKVNEEIAKLSITDVRRRLGLNLSRAVVGIASAQRLAELNRIAVDAARDRLKLTRMRLAAGVGDTRDLVRAQQDLAASRAQIAPADEALRQSREALAQLLGTTGELGLAADSEGLAAELLGFCGSAPPADRPDLLIAKKQIEVAKRNVDDITLKFFPTLTAQLSAGTVGPAFGGPFTNGWSISGVLTIPIYDGGIRYGEKRDRIAVVEEAKVRALQAEIGVVIERAQARRAIDVANAALGSAKEARDLAKEADRLARVAYAAGIGTNFDLIDAGRLLRQAETTLVLRELDVARAKISLPFIEGSCAGLG